MIEFEPYTIISGTNTGGPFDLNGRLILGWYAPAGMDASDITISWVTPEGVEVTLIRSSNNAWGDVTYQSNAINLFDRHGIDAAHGMFGQAILRSDVNESADRDMFLVFTNRGG